MGRSKYKERSGKGGEALNNWKKITQNKVLEYIKWKSNKYTLEMEEYHKRSCPTFGG